MEVVSICIVLNVHSYLKKLNSLTGSNWTYSHYSLQLLAYPDHIIIDELGLLNHHKNNLSKKISQL